MKNHFWKMFANLKNAQFAKRNFIIQKRTKKCEMLLKLLTNENFILGYSLESKKIKIFLKYKKGRPVINKIKLISKPSRQIYYSVKHIWKINSNKLFIIISTNKGLKSIEECKKLKIGGKPFVIVN